MKYHGRRNRCCILAIWKCIPRRFVLILLGGTMLLVAVGLCLLLLPGEYTDRLQEHPNGAAPSIRRNSRFMNSRLNKENRVKRKDEQFYVLEDTRVNHLDYDFLIDGKEICKHTDPFLVILVPSKLNDTMARSAIRETWGQFTHKIWPNCTVEDETRLVFLVAKGNDSNDSNDYTGLHQEADTFKDIVQVDFLDSYRNLTLKVLMGLRWVSTFCSQSKFVLKADQDMFVSIPNLLKYLKHFGPGTNGTIFGRLYRNAKAHRQEGDRWYVSRQEFPFQTYPVYVSGNSYVLSGNLVSKFAHISEYVKPLHLEDVFITGILARIAKARHVNVPGTADWLNKPPDPCLFVGTDTVSATSVSPELMVKIWKTLLTDHNSCLVRGTTSAEGVVTMKDLSKHHYNH